MINKKYNIVSIIQARISSNRLPGKVLFKLGDSNVLGQVIQRAKEFSNEVIVCTSINSEDNEIANFCNSIDIYCYRGSLDNVFSRYREILIQKRFDKYRWFARITADNPLISVLLAENLITKISDNLDYIAYRNKEINIGTGIEIVNKKTFLNIDERKLDLAEKEHVTLNLYEKKGRYNCKFILSPFNNFDKRIRLTLDYQDDYKLLKKLFKLDKNISSERAIEIIRKDAYLMKINEKSLQKKIRE